MECTVLLYYTVPFCILFQEVFGDNQLFWFLPVFSSFGDGVSFPQRGQLDEEAGLLEGQSPTNAAGTTSSSSSPAAVTSTESELAVANGEFVAVNM